MTLEFPTLKKFNEFLEVWFREKKSDTIGQFGIEFIQIKGKENWYRLGGKTKREGVERYLYLLQDYDDDLEWTIVINEHGIVKNKVAFGPHKEVIEGFYLYLYR